MVKFINKCLYGCFLLTDFSYRSFKAEVTNRWPAGWLLLGIGMIYLKLDFHVCLHDHNLTFELMFPDLDTSRSYVDRTGLWIIKRVCLHLYAIVKILKTAYKRWIILPSSSVINLILVFDSWFHLALVFCAQNFWGFLVSNY